ncbi:plasmid stabilization protein [Labrys miyagiensis]|uniref:Plasmid stabilization protein n=1 Tax=Labrys miyagiensis TaxID=346912 RepID=A0ABQ6CFL3_9HYPH|nr:type II toxin-antitoxin system RelE/ParE family toxin [Labrys miyagiensis]GLS19063.1 plasmid stabilization protein [Labrys miyagiensis]
MSCAFSELAESDLLEIALHIASDSPMRALSFVADIRRHCFSLAKNPGLYRLREEYGSGVRVAVHGNYLIFYAERRSGEVVIERVLHGARHLDWVQI